MKTKIFITVVIASLALLVSATVWEGVTDVVSKGDMPGNYSVATNAFPRNSVVDITNLENGKMVRALVVSGLETTGLLATLSRNAADSIDLRGNSTCRIRITQPSDDIAFSNFKLGPIAAPPPSASQQNTISGNNVSDSANRAEAQGYNTVVEEFDYRTDAANGIDNAAAANNRAYPVAVSAITGTAAVAVTEETDEPYWAEENTGIIMAQTTPETTTKSNVRDITWTTAGTRSAETPADDSAETWTNTWPGEASAQTVAEITPYDTVVTEEDAQAMAAADTETPVDTFAYTDEDPVTAAVDNPPESRNAAGNLTIIPSEKRIPEAANQFTVAPEERAPPLNRTGYAAASPETSGFSPFQVPLINGLEQDKWYVQLAAYKRVEHVEDEINRIGTAYPLAVQNIGTDANPMFRVLLGPLNQGESGALLQRFKSIGYSDAFIRHN